MSLTPAERWKLETLNDGPPEEDQDGVSLEDLRLEWERTLQEDVGNRAPRGRTKRGVPLVQFNIKIDTTRMAILEKICGKRGLDPRYETTSHLGRWFIDFGLKKIFEEVDNDELSSLYASAIEEAESLSMKALLANQNTFVEEMIEASEENCHDREALELMRLKVLAYLPSAATTDIRDRLLDIDWEAKPRKKAR